MVAKQTPKQKKGGKTSPRPEKKSSTGFYLILGGVALAGVAALILVRGGDASAPENLPVSVASTNVQGSGAVGISTGGEDAPVTIIEFEDFLCPHCRDFNAFSGKLIRREFATGDDPLVRWVVYEFPLGQASWAPALAGRCAGDQGAYWEMHDVLYARTEEWAGEANPNGTFIDFADELGLDTGQFRECLSEREHLSDIAAARKYGESLGVNGTPALYLNGRKLTLRTDADYESLKALIIEAAANAEAAGAAESETASADAASDG